MGRRVVVIASGETERRALPHLTVHLHNEGIAIVGVRRPDGNKTLTVEMAERLIKAAWFAVAEEERPDKYVILLDTDRNDPEQVLQPFREQLPERVRNIPASLQFAYAQRHLEAWYFADSAGLREYLGRDLGNIDASKPDQIENPKLHLKNLLADRVYTAVVSEEIARTLDAEAMRRSASFQGFVAAVRNGQLADAAAS